MLSLRAIFKAVDEARHLMSVLRLWLERRLRSTYHAARDVASLACTCREASEGAKAAWHKISDMCFIKASDASCRPLFCINLGRILFHGANPMRCSISWSSGFRVLQIKGSL